MFDKNEMSDKFIKMLKKRHSAFIYVLCKDEKRCDFMEEKKGSSLLYKCEYRKAGGFCTNAEVMQDLGLVYEDKRDTQSKGLEKHSAK